MDLVRKCPLCKAYYSSLFEQVTHVRNAHSSSKVQFSCIIEECGSQFVNTNTYYKHVRNFHHEEYFKVQLTSDASPDVDLPSSSNEELPPTCTLAAFNTGHAENNEVDFEGDASSLCSTISYKETAAKYLMRLKLDHKLSQKALDVVVEMNKDMVKAVTDDLKAKVENELQCHNASLELYQGINNVFESDVMNPLEGLKSAYLQRKYIESHFPYVVSIAIIIIIIIIAT